jgi:hypothetical protein
VCIEDDDFVIVEEDKIVNFNPTEYFVSENGTYAILMLMLNAPAEENCTVPKEVLKQNYVFQY